MERKKLKQPEVIIKEIMYSEDKKEPLNYLGNFIISILMIQTPSLINEIMGERNIPVDDGSKTIANAMNNMANSIANFTDFMSSMIQIMGMMLFIYTMLSLYRSENKERFIENKKKNFNSYSLIELLYTLDYLKNNKKNIELQSSLVIHLKSITKDENINKLEKSDFKNYCKEFENIKKKNELEKLIIERDKLNKKINGNKITLDEIIEIESE